MTGGPHRLPGKPGHLREPNRPKLRPFSGGSRNCPVCGHPATAVNYRCARHASPCGDPRPHLHDECSECGVGWVTKTYENRSLWQKLEPEPLFIVLIAAMGIAMFAGLVAKYWW